MHFLLWLNEIFTQQVAMHFDLYYSKQGYVEMANKRIKEETRQLALF